MKFALATFALEPIPFSNFGSGCSPTIVLGRPTVLSSGFGLGLAASSTILGLPQFFISRRHFCQNAVGPRPSRSSNPVLSAPSRRL
jgi:hypothetical protein